MMTFLGGATAAFFPALPSHRQSFRGRARTEEILSFSLTTMRYTCKEKEREGSRREARDRGVKSPSTLWRLWRLLTMGQVFREAWLWKALLKCPGDEQVGDVLRQASVPAATVPLPGVVLCEHRTLSLLSSSLTAPCSAGAGSPLQQQGRRRQVLLVHPERRLQPNRLLP